jgi:hypothetical protein
MQQTLCSLFFTLFFCSNHPKPSTIQKIDCIVYGVYCGEGDRRFSTMFKIDDNHLFIDTTDSFLKRENT